MQWFSALIPAYPEIQAKAHEELDRVVGRNRLPTIDDEKNLSFIHAIIKVSVSGINCTPFTQQSYRKLSAATTHSGSARPM